MGEMSDDISTEWWEPPTVAQIAPGLVASLEYLIDEYGYAGVLRTLQMMEAHT